VVYQNTRSRIINVGVVSHIDTFPFDQNESYFERDNRARVVSSGAADFQVGFKQNI
jgi:hypothetical protein